MPSPSNHPRDPLHGTTLEAVLNQLVQRYGWGEMGRRIPVRCFQFNPTVKSSLTFLRKTPWAREKVEDWFIRDQLRKEPSSKQPQMTNAGMSPSTPRPLAASQTADALLTLWQSTSPQNWGDFLGHLDRGAIPYLSPSKLTSLERCPLCYYRQYVLGEKQEPAGVSLDALFHRAAKVFYEALRVNKLPAPVATALPLDPRLLPEASRPSLHNALELLQANYWADHEVLSVEEGFFMDLAPGLPPLLSIPDLVLRQEGSLLVVDHKTSKSFNDLDAAPLVLFAEHLRRQHATDSVIGVFDEYRLVANLATIQKPAFRRTRVCVDRTVLPELTARYQKAWEKIVSLHQSGPPSASPDCWICNKNSSSWK